MTLLLKWAIMVVALVVSALLVGLVMPGGITVSVGSAGGWMALFVGVLILAMANATIGALAKLVFLPLNCLTLGLASLVINTLVFWLVGSLGWGFAVHGFWPAFLGSILYSAANGALEAFVPDEDRRERASRSRK